MFVTQSPLAGIAVLTALMMGLGLCAAAVGGLLSGWPGIESTAIAVALCWIPGVLIFAIEPRFRTPTGQVAVVLVGTFMRIAVAAGGMLMLMQLRPETPRPVFMASVLVLYLASLAWETTVLSARSPASSEMPGFSSKS